MRYDTLACDYDETLARNGVVGESAANALHRFRGAGGKLLLVTGRELEDLRGLFPRLDLFERIVAENGGVLYQPATGDLRLLAGRPPQSLIDHLRQRGVHPLRVGHVVLATREPYETAALEAVHALALEYHIIFNKGAVMLLPAHINKATGLKAALRELEIPLPQVAAIGDAENDHTFVTLCGLSAAVANALPSLQQHVQYVTRAENGAGVTEFVDLLLGDSNADRGEDPRS